MGLRAIIFDLDDTLIKSNGSPVEGVPELLDQLRKWNLRIVIVSNKPRQKGLKKLQNANLQFDLFITGEDLGVKKGSPEFILEPCKRIEIKTDQVIYVGHSNLDMRTSSNARAIFVNVTWAPKENDYGIKINSPDSLSKFISHYLMKNHLWYWKLEEMDRLGRRIKILCMIDGSAGGNREIKSYLILVLKEKRDIKVKGESFKSFLLFHLLGSIYLDGVYRGIDYWTTYPGHTQGSTNDVMGGFLEIAAKLFRDQYLDNLFIRHKDAQKSAYARHAREIVYFTNQTNTIHLNPQLKTKIRGKRILVIDDFTTKGYSFECARNILYYAEAEEVVCVSIGKYGPNYLIQTPKDSISWNPYTSQSFNENDFNKIEMRGINDQNAFMEFLDSYNKINLIKD